MIENQLWIWIWQQLDLQGSGATYQPDMLAPSQVVKKENKKRKIRHRKDKIKAVKEMSKDDHPDKQKTR